MKKSTVYKVVAWSFNFSVASDHHPQLAVASTDGTCNLYVGVN